MNLCNKWLNIYWNVIFFETIYPNITVHCTVSPLFSLLSLILNCFVDDWILIHKRDYLRNPFNSIPQKWLIAINCLKWTVIIWNQNFASKTKVLKICYDATTVCTFFNLLLFFTISKYLFSHNYIQKQLKIYVNNSLVFRSDEKKYLMKNPEQYRNTVLNETQ